MDYSFSWLTLYVHIFRWWHYFILLDNIEKIQEKLRLSFEYVWKNIMENRVLALMEPMLHFP